MTPHGFGFKIPIGISWELLFLLRIDGPADWAIRSLATQHGIRSSARLPVGSERKERAQKSNPVDSAQHWRLNDTECVVVAGCIDIDLSFTPATNLLPIRRLQLPIGNEAVVRAAWLRFPTFTLEPLEQTYRRAGAKSYRYETLAGKFDKDLVVNDAGFVTQYPGFWEIEEGN